MKPTITANYLLQPILYWFASFILFTIGWKVKGKVPEIKKFVLIAAPHSSNWDFVLFLLAVFKFKISVYWMGKHSMFIWPFKTILKQLGGIPINRSKKSNVVDTMAVTFSSSKELIVTIAPSGTRGKTVKWKSGFYHIACQAKVPIVFGFIDYDKKNIGLGQVFEPTGQIEADMKTLKKYYSQFSGKYQLEEESGP